MEIDFLKLFGCDADAILLDCRKQPAVLAVGAGRFAAGILSRRHGVGAESLVLLALEPGGGLSVRAWDRGGEETDPSAAALVCAARYACDAGMVPHESFPIVQRGGAVPARIIDSLHARLALGAPFSAQSGEALREVPNAPAPLSVAWDGKRLPYAAVRFEKPYGILFAGSFEAFEEADAGRLSMPVEAPGGTQMGLVRIDSRDALRLKAPRGDAPPDRGRLAAAAVVASVLQGLTDREVFVSAGRSRMFLQWNEEPNLVYLTAPAHYIFTGTYDYVEEKQQSR